MVAIGGGMHSAEQEGRTVSETRIGILALQGDFDAHARALTAGGLTPVLVRRPDELRSVAGLVLPGGESTTLIRLLRAYGLWEPLRRFPAQGKILLGTCAGLILMARRVQGPEQASLGLLPATVERNAYGRQVDSFVVPGTVLLPADLGFERPTAQSEGPWGSGAAGRVVPDGAAVSGLTSTAAGAAVAEFETPATDSRPAATEFVFIRAPRIVALDPRVEVLARHAGAPVLVRHENLLGASFHPELATDGIVVSIFAAMVAQAQRRRPAQG